MGVEKTEIGDTGIGRYVMYDIGKERLVERIDLNFNVHLRNYVDVDENKETLKLRINTSILEIKKHLESVIAKIDKHVEESKGGGK